MALALIQWNCRGFQANRPDIEKLTIDHIPLVFCLQETLIKNVTTAIKGYVSYHKPATVDRLQRPHGGSSIFVERSIPQRPVTLTTNIEAVAARITIESVTITICSIYISPHYILHLNELNELIHQLPKPYILMGNFNAHSVLWGGSSTDAKGRIIEQLLAETSLCLWNTKEPTYIHPGTGSQTSIDLTICSPTLFQDFTWKTAQDTMGSDHLPIFLSLNIPPVVNSIPKWKLHKADWKYFKYLCENELPHYNFLSDPDPIETFQQHILSISYRSIPRSSTKPSKPKKPWFDEECNENIKQRNRAFRLMCHSPTEENIALYRLHRAKVRKIIKFKKKASWQAYVSSLSNTTSIKKMWAMIRKITGKETNAHIGHLFIKDAEVTTANDISNTLAESFATNSSLDQCSKDFLVNKRKAEAKILHFNCTSQHIYNIDFSLRELKNALLGSKNTSPGPDDIHYEIIRNLPESGLKILLSIFNSIWDSGNFPTNWKKAIIIPIGKPGKDLTNPTSYRPISLTSCVCKTMERMINNRLIWYLEHNNLLNEYQSGFRHGRSTADHLVRFETFIREAFVNRQHLVAVFFDLEKAYDTTWKYGIMQDLYEMGLRGRLPLFIKNFLSDRTFQVRLGTVLSSSHTQEMGVPQGSILSVTLFNIKINSITKCLGTNTDCSLYVDDFLICYRSSYMPTIERQLQGCINKLCTWSNKNGFKFSPAKTVCMHFCQKRSQHADPILYLQHTQIPVVTQNKFLGVIFDNKLSFIPHLKHLKVKCQKALNVLKVVGHYNWGADRKTLLMLYRSIIRAKLDYGCIVYGSARFSYRKMLDTIQNQALRICLGAFRTSPANSLCVEANEPPLELRREQLSLMYALRLKCHSSNPAYQCVFVPNYEEKFKNRNTCVYPFGLRIKIYLEDMELDLDPLLQQGQLEFPPWIHSPPLVDLTLSNNPKHTTSPEVFKQKYLELREKYIDHIPVFTDGSKMAKKVASAALVEGNALTRRLPDDSSIFSAELTAIIIALNFISQSQNNNYIIYSDSLSCLKALQTYSITNPLLQEIVYILSNLPEKNIIFVWIPSHIGILGNEKVDKLAKSALDSTYIHSSIPGSDLKPSIRQYIKNKWQNLWTLTDNNKLKEIKPIIGEHPMSTSKQRQQEVILTRLRIGHTHFTHSYAPSRMAHL